MVCRASVTGGPARQSANAVAQAAGGGRGNSLGIIPTGRKGLAPGADPGEVSGMQRAEVAGRGAWDTRASA